MPMDVARIAGGTIALVISIVLIVNTINTVVDGVQDVNTTGWTFTGYEGAESLMGLIPFSYIAGALILAVVGALSLARGLGMG